MCIDQQIVVARKQRTKKKNYIQTAVLDVMEKLIFMVNPDFELHSIIIYFMEYFEISFFFFLLKCYTELINQCFFLIFCSVLFIPT